MPGRPGTSSRVTGYAIVQGSRPQYLIESLTCPVALLAAPAGPVALGSAPGRPIARQDAPARPIARASRRLGSTPRRPIARQDAPARSHIARQDVFGILFCFVVKAGTTPFGPDQMVRSLSTLSGVR